LNFESYSFIQHINEEKLSSLKAGFKGNHRPKQQISALFMLPLARHPDRMNKHLTRKKLIIVASADGYISSCSQWQ
jgi:hypothetical protein